MREGVRCNCTLRISGVPSVASLTCVTRMMRAVDRRRCSCARRKKASSRAGWIVTGLRTVTETPARVLNVTSVRDSLNVDPGSSIRTSSSRYSVNRSLLPRGADWVIRHITICRAASTVDP